MNQERFARHYRSDQIITLAGERLLWRERERIRVTKRTGRDALMMMHHDLLGDAFGEVSGTTRQDRRETKVLGDVTVRSISPDAMPSSDRLVLHANLARPIGRGMNRGDHLLSRTLPQRIVIVCSSLEVSHIPPGGVTAEGRTCEGLEQPWTRFAYAPQHVNHRISNA
jgi:hypothetical protein